MSYPVPILFVIFNKQEETKRVFETIRFQKPTSLFIAADGPRVDKEGEIERCESVRSWVLNNIDWECEVKTKFRVDNIGCGRGPSEAISWFFEQVEEGIILEDDCLPNASFFDYCKALLPKYREDSRISILSANNFQPNQPLRLDGDYYFSVFPSTNGWATWNRTWKDYDYFISKWNTIDKKEFLSYLFKEKKYQLWWKQMFDFVYKTKPEDMWDFQFHFHCMQRKQLAIIPKVNLVTNIGYGADATHSSDPNNYFANFKMYELDFPLKHPTDVVRNEVADLFIQQNLFGESEIVSFLKKIKRYIKRSIRYKAN